MISQEMTWSEINDEFGPLVEIASLPSGGWDIAAIHTARLAHRLWTRVEPGLVSTGFHYVNLETYFVASRPHPPDVDICEVDEDIDECSKCLDWTYNGRGSLCSDCADEIGVASPV